MLINKHVLSSRDVIIRPGGVLRHLVVVMMTAVVIGCRLRVLN
jgi:hypothetical protein